MSDIREEHILRKVIGDYFLSFMCETNAFVAGGAVRAVFSSEPIVDIDIFFPTKEAFEEATDSFVGEEDSPSFSITDSAWTHIGTGDSSYIPKKMRFQLICAEFGTPEEIIKKFDFTMCMGAWDPRGGAFLLDPFFLKHIAQHRLCFNTNAEYPICSLWRAAKFIKRGWKLPGVEAIKLALAIHNVKIDTHSDLKKQLLGIDTLYLKELTDALETDAEKRYDFGEAINFIASFFEDQDGEE